MSIGAAAQTTQDSQQRRLAWDQEVQPLRVALFTDTYEQTNGVTRTLSRLLHHCTGLGFTVHIYTYGREGAEDVGDRSKVFRYAPLLPIEYYPDMHFDVAIANARLARRFRSYDYDVVHLATPGSMGLIGYELARQRALPLLGSYHTHVADYVRARVRVKFLGDQFAALTWSYLRWFYNQCEIVLAPSRPVKAKLEEHLRVPVALFPRGVDTDVFHPRYAEPHEKTRVLYVGRLAEEKNLEMLVAAFRALDEDAVLQIVGDGPLYSELRALAGGKVQVLGPRYGEELSRVYASADVFAFPSLTDTFGIVVLEAMSSELPAVVMNEGGPKDIVTDGHDGFVVSDREMMTDRLRLLIRDAELRRAIGKRARQTAEARSWDAAFEDLLDSYRQVAAHAT